MAGTIVALLLFSPICGLLLYVCYNLSFHPLASYPGPKLAAATPLPWATAVFLGRISHWAHELHQKYGDVVRIGPNELSYASADSWKDIYARHPGHVLLPKSPSFYHQPPGGSPGIISSDHLTNNRMRRVLNHAFSDKALREQESLIKDLIDLWIRRLHEYCRTPLDIVAWYNWLTFDIIGDLAFGESFECVKKAQYHEWVSQLFAVIKTSALLQSATALPGGQTLLQILVTSGDATRSMHMDYTLKKVGKRLTETTDRKDFMSYILKERKDGSEMSVGEIQATSFEFILAGSETTATLLSGVTNLLLNHPDVLGRLTEEVRGSFSSESEIDITGCNRLPYVLAVLDEGMRMYPPVAFGGPRIVPEGGKTINGKYVSAGTTVSTNHWATYHNPRNFVMPDEFHPERFLGDPQFDSDKKEALQPFLVGPRSCIGRNLAYAEMRLILVRLLWNFDLEKVDDGVWEKQKMWVVWEKPPLRAKLVPRNLNNEKSQR